MIYFQIIYEFFKIGLFSFGGGYATIPFLYHISEQYNWYSLEELKQMVAVASITPGPVGINVATYAGLKTAGVFGALSATIFEMLPSLILVLICVSTVSVFAFFRSHVPVLSGVSGCQVRPGFSPSAGCVSGNAEAVDVDLSGNGKKHRTGLCGTVFGNLCDFDFVPFSEERSGAGAKIRRSGLSGGGLYCGALQPSVDGSPDRGCGLSVPFLYE